jgi:lysophospholipase L1-like esterase
MKHIVLAGDSVFDNAAYVNGGTDVISHLRQQMPGDWKATLVAVDGSVIQRVRGQVMKLPSDATNLVVSVGGNDALGHADLLQQKAQSVAEVLDKLAAAAEDFQYQYHEMLRSILEAGVSTAVCTIYYPRFPEPLIQRLAITALTVFNDVIIREAFLAGIPLLDLRLICDRDEDYANPIEPSEAGGRKIAAAIIRMIKEHRIESRRTEIFI